jgi:DNA-binding NarL/FixJ family response regulator
MTKKRYKRLTQPDRELMYKLLREGIEYEAIAAELGVSKHTVQRHAKAASADTSSGIIPRRRPYTPEEGDTILRLRRERKTWANIADALGRGRGAADNTRAMREAYEAALAREAGPEAAAPEPQTGPWSDEEQAALDKMAAEGKCFADIAAALGRSEKAVMGRIRRLLDAGYQPAELAKDGFRRMPSGCMQRVTSAQGVRRVTHKQV